jgi:magnesium chelatase family protein
VPYRELRAGEIAESSADMLERVERARRIQYERGYMNSPMPARLIRKQCALDETGERTLRTAMRGMSLSARAHGGGSRRARLSPRPFSTAGVTDHAHASIV